MFDSAAPPSSDPGLIEWLKADRWEDDFSAQSVVRGRRYYREGRVQLPLQTKLRIGIDEPIEATVKGTRSKPYRVSLDFFEVVDIGGSNWTVEGDCSCPVIDQCKHAAAVLCHLAAQVRDLADPKASDSSPPGSSAVSPLGRDAEHWISGLREAAGAPAPGMGSSSTDFLAYCVEPWQFYASDCRHRLVLRPATFAKDGSVRIKGSEARPSILSPARYLSIEDLPMVAMYAALQGRSGAVPLSGPGWAPILDQAASWGRLFLGVEQGEDYDDDLSYVKLTVGADLTGTLTWSQRPDGGYAPKVELGGSDRILLRCDPPRYVDPVAEAIGSVHAEQPSSLLLHWADGPEIPPAEVPSLGSALALVETAEPLPVAEEIPTRELAGLEPRPRLRMEQAEIGRYDRFSTILGVLSFQYGNSPPLLPLTNSAPERASWMEEGTLMVLKRNRNQERALERSLYALDLVPMHELKSAIDLSSETLHAVMVSDPFPSLESAWLTWLDAHAEDLRAQGWVVEIAPDSGLVVHDFTEFVPAIQADPDHGIDWFQFSLQGTFGQQTISLIPFIALAIEAGLPDPEDEELPEYLMLPGPEGELLRLPVRPFIELCHQVAHLFVGREAGDDSVMLDRLAAAGVAHSLEVDDSETTRALTRLGQRLHEIQSLPKTRVPARLKADLRPYQRDGYRWLRFLAENQLSGILADDMGLGKTVQTLAALAVRKRGAPPSLVVAPTSVVGNWAAEAERFVPGLKVLLLHGSKRAEEFAKIPKADLVLTSYPLLVRDHETLKEQEWQTVVLDEAQYIKNPKTAVAQRACELRAAHRLCLSGTPMENHLGELWSLMRFLMPGLLGDLKSFSSTIRRPIERDQDAGVQSALNRRVAPLILRRTKDEVATELPPKTEIIHSIALGKKEVDLYESVRAAMDKRVRDALAAKGLAKSHIIVLDALLKLRQICCHPTLLKTPAAQKLQDGSKLSFLVQRLLPELIAEGRRILLFSQFTSMLSLIEKELRATKTPFLKLTGRTKNRSALVKEFQEGSAPIFLISLKAGGTGLNLTAADTVIHYDPWWNPSVESQATDRAHRIGQERPVFVHKLICEGSIENRILELQKRKSDLVKALLSKETTKLEITPETLSHLFAPLV